VQHTLIYILRKISNWNLPPIATFFVQPIDIGIVKKLKTFYRAKLVNYNLEAIQENLLTSSSTAKDVSAQIGLLQAVQFIANC
jgi:hypothetical protein